MLHQNSFQAVTHLFFEISPRHQQGIHQYYHNLMQAHIFIHYKSLKSHSKDMPNTDSKILIVNKINGTSCCN